MNARTKPNVIVLMGVSGCGKSTIGEHLGAALGWPYADADSFHPPANVAKMSAGHALNDHDRAPWLTAIVAHIDAARNAGAHAIVSCSALKRVYRNVLIGARNDVALVFLDGSKEAIAKRLSARHAHFMPPALLDSQFAALEQPSADEHALIVSVEQTPDAIVGAIISGLELAKR